MDRSESAPSPGAYWLGPKDSPQGVDPLKTNGAAVNPPFSSSKIELSGETVIIRRHPYGRNSMTALTAGSKAPDFELKAMDGRRFVLRDELALGPIILAFFKVSCPTCQYAFPFLERLERAYGHKGVRVIGVSQNDPRDTANFTKEFGVTFPVLLDDAKTYPVSNAYGLTNVPTIFWIAQDAQIEISSVGWVKAEFEQIGRKMAEYAKIAPAVIFKPGEDVRDFRAG
jgi:peroxiredoxin